MNDNFDMPPAFINVIVIVTKNDDSLGNVDDGLHTVTTIPSTIKVTRPNTIVNFQIIPPTAPEIVFAGMERAPSKGVRQLSNATISLDQKMLTFTDWNSDHEEVAVTLLFSGSGGNIKHDPQIQNVPEA